MDEKLKKVLFALCDSHSRLAQAEYDRNASYNNQHFSHKAEEGILEYLREIGLQDELMEYIKDARN